MADIAKAKSERIKAHGMYKTAVGAVRFHCRRATQGTPVNMRIVQQKLNSLTAAYEDLKEAHADYVSKAELAEDDDQGEAWIRRIDECLEVLQAGEVILDIA